MKYIHSYQVDHVNGDGSQHVAKNGKRLSGHDLILYIIRHNYPKGEFAILCANCNFAKGQRGYCPLFNQVH
jgi:hypothetical protein